MNTTRADQKVAELLCGGLSGVAVARTIACCLLVALAPPGHAQQPGQDPADSLPELYDYNNDLRVDLDDFWLFADDFGFVVAGG